MKSEGIIFPEPNEVSFGEVEVADPEPGDAVVRVTHTILSTGTDTRTLRGGQVPPDQFPLVPSYSSVGIVEEVLGDGAHVRKGDRVFAGGVKALVGITRCWGAQVRHCVKPARELVKLDDRQPLDCYAFAKVGAIALHGVRRSLAEPGDSVLVMGQGLIGQLHARIQAAFGQDLIVADLLPGRLQKSLAGGAQRAVNVREEDLTAVIAESWPGGPQVAVEATARQEGIDQCADLLRGRAWGGDDRMPMLVLQATYVDRISFDPTQFFMKEYVVVSPRDNDRRDLVGAACMIGAGALRVSDLITLRSAPQDAAEAFEGLLANPNDHFTVVFEWE
jgi:2-desacetyl-2-hydroxyethyl bacteriochlorophyllide A dehydrogenase